MFCCVLFLFQILIIIIGMYFVWGIFIFFYLGTFVNTPHPKGDDEEEEERGSFPTIPCRLRVPKSSAGISDASALLMAIFRHFFCSKMALIVFYFLLNFLKKCFFFIFKQLNSNNECHRIISTIDKK